MFRMFRRAPWIGIALLLAALLAGCGEDEEVAPQLVGPSVTRTPVPTESPDAAPTPGAVTVPAHVESMTLGRGSAWALGWSARGLVINSATGTWIADLSGPLALDDPALAETSIREALRRHVGLNGIYSLGAGNRGLIRALREVDPHGRPVVIAHELTASTGQALLDGTIDAVLNQDAGHEVRSAIRVLKAKADGLPVLAAQERIRIDIFLKDNLP